MREPPKSALSGSAFEVPDLDLGAPPPARSPAARPPAARPSAARAPVNRPEEAYFGASVASLDDDFEFDEAVALEAVAPTVDTRPWPLGRSGEPKRGLLAPQLIAQRAGYGSPDVPFYLAPAYTWRVWSRRRALTRSIQSQERELAARETERDRLLVELAISLENTLEKQDRFREILSELAAATRAFEGHERALASTNAAIAGQLEQHDAELARLEPERVERAKLVQARQGERDAKATEQQRAHAKLKRVQIEIRNVTDKGRALLGPRGGELPPELARQLAALKDAEAPIAREFAEHDAGLAAASAALASAERPLAETQRAMDAIRQKKQQLVESTRQKVASEASQLHGAEATHTEVAKRIAIAVLDMKGSIPVDRAVLDRIQAADDRADSALVDLEKSRLAFDSFDRGSYGLGLKIVLAPFAFLLALVLLRVLL